MQISGAKPLDETQPPRQPPPYVEAPLADEAATTACTCAACALNVCAKANVEAGPDPDANVA
ncbi:hypothetical protein A4G26_28275 [Mycobacterium kansasii]|uniref:Uncharacterized protein n=2 Tax=Mycobacterium innocens TaxID=2341083 RepID=A0A498QIA3_9MYCO|nr:hypothetical protein A4G26_28275 [Mycobacterium kansasii]VBA45664.1 hypothetical protein LAUMK13_05505 [Mycobacterium innocens]